MNAPWVTVDVQGYRKILARRGKSFIPWELIQNAWDTQAKNVQVDLTREPGSRHVTLRVEDDDPVGFVNPAHAHTLYAESIKKANPALRGRHNSGDKSVLVMCDKAEIRSTKGGFRFDSDGRHVIHEKRERGTLFVGVIRMTLGEQAECEAAVRRLIPPPGITTVFNGEVLPERKPVATFEASLRTEVADEEGNLRPATRKATVAVYKPLPGEVASLYEMGIPVVETGDTFHVDVLQKVPLNLERDNVPPAYLRTLRTLVLNATHALLDRDTANTPWVRDALGDKRISVEAVRKTLTARFGEKAVCRDPSDPEANGTAFSEGYTVVNGSQLSHQEWENARRAGMLPPAGRVTPSPKPFSDHPDANPLALVPEADWSDGERLFIQRVRRIAQALINREIVVRIAHDRNWSTVACYGGREMTFNRARLGRQFFIEGLTERVLSLIIHELGHEYVSDHLSRAYYDTLTKLGARLALAAVHDPSLLA